MNIIVKIQPLVIIVTALVGLFVGQLACVDWFQPVVIEVFLICLLTVLFLGVDVHSLGSAFVNRRYTPLALGINFVITPFLAYGLGLVFFPDQVVIQIGLFMLLMTPCTDWYLVFTALAKGNVGLNLSLLPLNLLLQIGLMPIYLWLAMGSSVQLAFGRLLWSSALVLLVPMALALLIKGILRYRPKILARLRAQSDGFQLFFLCLAVFGMFAAEGKNVLTSPLLALQLFIPLLLFFALIFLVANALAGVFHLPRGERIALIFTTMARNSPLALAIAVASFPDQPLIALVLVLGPLIELPVLASVASVLARWR